MKETDYRPCRLLRARRERPRCHRATNKRDEFPPSHPSSPQTAFFADSLSRQGLRVNGSTLTVVGQFEISASDFFVRPALSRLRIRRFDQRYDITNLPKPIGHASRHRG